MMFSKLVTLSPLLALFMFSLVLSQPGCPLSGADEKFLIERRKQALRAGLLAQLGLKNNTSFPTFNKTVTKEQLDTYLALSEAAASREEEKQRQCQSEEIYARPITTIVGTVDDHSRHKLGRRYVSSENVLNTIDLEFDFRLKEGLTSITRGDIILYQHELPGNVYVKDKMQYIEIKAVFDSIGLKTVVAAKNLNVYEKGFQAFDITSAVKLWAQKQINGTVHLEITVSCFSSKTCALGNGNEPITFDFDSEIRKPKLVIVSQNPLEVSNGNRVRRQATGGECNDKQSTCCLKKLTINFERDLGMGFVILPKEFEANYCEGICLITPGGSLMTPELYSFITKLSNHPAASLEPCCAGNTFKPLLIVLPDRSIPGGTVTEELQQVTVESCRCA